MNGNPGGGDDPDRNNGTPSRDDHISDNPFSAFANAEPEAKCQSNLCSWFQLEPSDSATWKHHCNQKQISCVLTWHP
eukprot:4046453-Amphidinium_carterae.1